MSRHVLTDYSQIFLRRRWFILGFTCLVLATVAYFSFSMTPMYRATALILIEKEQTNVYNTSREAVMVESSQQDYYQTQYNILQSRALAKSTLDSLPTLHQQPDYRRSTDRVARFLQSLTIEPILNTRLVKVHFESPQPSLAAQVVNTLADRYVKQNQDSRMFISKDILQTLQPNTKTAKKGPTPITLPDYESLPSVVNNRLIQELKTDYARLEAQRAELSERYTPMHPSMKRLDSQIQQLRNRINTEVKKIAEAVKAELSGQLQGNNIRIIDRAEVPTDPVRPRPAMNLALGLFFGLLVGSLLALLLDQMDSTVKDPEDIEKMVKVPFLGAIPWMSRFHGGLLKRQNPYLVTFESPHSLMAESFRNIRASLLFSTINPPLAGLLITSTVAGEGKTFVAANVAIAFAQLGERVLLVDGDLRKPHLHSVFDLSMDHGLSSLLTSHDSPANAISGTEIPGLYVMTSGPQPNNPAELLSSHRLQLFFEWATREYDRVIVDGPPAITCSDALLLSKVLKNTLVVIQSGKTQSDWAVRTCRKLKHSADQRVWAVINQARWGFSHYHYYSAPAEIAEAAPTPAPTEKRRNLIRSR